MALVEVNDRVQLTATLRSYFEEIATEVDGGYLATSERPDLEIGWQREMCLARMAELRDQLATTVYDGEVQFAAARILGTDPATLAELPAAQVADACQGVTRAELEKLRLSLHRLCDRLTPHTSTDPLFAGSLPYGTLVAPTIALAELSSGPSLKTVVDDHLKAGKERWTKKTYEGKRTKLGYLTEHIGGETAIKAITSDSIRSYKAAIIRLRSNHHAGKAKSFAEKQTPNEKHRIAPETVRNIFNPTRAFFAWATDVGGYLRTNPAANIRIEGPKKTKGRKSRRPFNALELRSLFSAPVFTGCASSKRRFTAGAEKLRDDYFWIPVLGYYTGARLGELVQLHLGDVEVNSSTPHIEITEATDKPATDQNRKHVKSEAGIRQIPLHPDVMALGFADFVNSRRKRKSTPRLFYPIKLGADGQASTVFSKWFARLLDKEDMKDPTLTFHSLRHGVQDALRDAKLPQYIIDKLFGHSSGTTAGGYGAGASLDVLADAVRSMKLPVRLPELWASGG